MKILQLQPDGEWLPCLRFMSWEEVAECQTIISVDSHGIVTTKCRGNYFQYKEAKQ